MFPLPSPSSSSSVRGHQSRSGRPSGQQRISFENNLDNSHGYFLNDGGTISTSNYIQPALMVLKKNGIPIETSLLDALCRRDTLAAIEQLMKSTPEQRLLALECSGLHLKCTEPEEKLLNIESGRHMPHRAVSNSSASSQISGTTLAPSNSGKSTSSRYRARYASQRHETVNQEDDFASGSSSHSVVTVIPSSAALPESSVPHSDTLAPQREPDPIPPSPYTDTHFYRIENRKDLSQNNLRSPVMIPEQRHNVHDDEWHNLAPQSTHFPNNHLRPTDVRHPPKSSQQSVSNASYPIRRKPVGSGSKPACAPMQIEYEHPTTKQHGQRLEVTCHLCSEIPKKFCKRLEFEKHLDADHAKRLEFLCKHQYLSDSGQWRRCRQHTFRRSEWTKHHTRDHGQTCFEGGVEKPQCLQERPASSDYLDRPCPQCKRQFTSHDDWFSHHIDHFNEAYSSLLMKMCGTSTPIPLIETPKRDRKWASDDSSPSPTERQSTHRHVNKSPRLTNVAFDHDVQQLFASDIRDDASSISFDPFFGDDGFLVTNFANYNADFGERNW